MNRALATLVLCAATTVASAHIVPIPPSVCAPDVSFSVPDGPTGAAAIAGTSDLLRIRFLAAAGEAVFCPADTANPATACAAPQSRAFTVGDATGTMSFPSLIAADIFSSGDIESPLVPITFARAGGTLAVPVTLTTGLAAAGGVVVEGASIADFGSFTLVGVTDATAVSPALAGRTLVIRITCRATPAPDIDQFPLLPEAVMSGTITKRRVSIRAVLPTNPVPSADLAAQPAMVRVRSGDATVGAALLPDGLVLRGRRFTGATSDGRASISIVPRRNGTWIVSVMLQDATMPPEAGGRALVDLALDVSGMLARGEALFVGNASRLRGK